MKFEDLFQNTFKAHRKEISSEVRKAVDFLLPSIPMVDACRADDFDFFRPWIDLGLLTVEQMRHAAHCYYLGKSKSGKPIFWMIDDMYQPLDGRIGDNWVSQALKAREPLLQYWQVSHCLFGLHLLCHTDSTDFTNKNPLDSECHTEITENTERNPLDWGFKNFSDFRDICVTNKPIGVVESEVSAVILSELYPNRMWLSVVPETCFTIDLLEPLRGCNVTVYPHTDTTYSNYLAWLDIADMARQAYHLDITVSRSLEDAASSEQKAREIDILHYLYDLKCATIRPELRLQTP